MRVVAAAVVYFACVFAAGFAFGAVRVPWLVPRLGERAAELLELPCMVVVVALVARWRQRRTPALPPRQQLVVGGLAWLLLLAAECVLGAWLLGRSPAEVLLAHDPVSGLVYYAATILFALGPWYWACRAPPRPASGPAAPPPR